MAVAGSNPVIRSRLRKIIKEKVMLTLVGWIAFLSFSGFVGYAIFAD